MTNQINVDKTHLSNSPLPSVLDFFLAGNVTPFHMQPFTVRELEQLSLAQRIAKCPQLDNIRFMYPKIDKEEVLRKFEGEERNKSPSPSNMEGGYIGCNIVMVAKQPSTSG